MQAGGLLEFGPFRLDLARRIVSRSGKVVPLPSKAIDVLLVLAQNPHEIVTKDELMKTVWPGTFVEEGNLTQMIFLLRKALEDAEGQTFIVTVPRQGYRFAGDVTRIAIGHPDPNPPARPETPSTTRRAGIPRSWAAAGVLGMLAALGWWYALRASRPVPSPVMNLSVDLGPDALWGQGSTVVLSPDGTRMVYRTRLADGKSMLAMRALDLPPNRAALTLLPGTVGATIPFFSPDGKWLAFTADKKLRRIPTNGGAPVTICDITDFVGGSWSANNKIIATLGSDFGLWQIDAAGGTPQLIAKPTDYKQGAFMWPQALPGGDAVIYTANEGVKNFDDASIEALSLKTGQRKTVQRGAYYGRYLPSGHLVWVRNRTLYAARFDLLRLEIKGRPVTLIEEDLAVTSDDASGEFDFSPTGTFVYLAGGVERSIVWMDQEGKTQPLIATPARYRDPSLSPDGKLLAVATGMAQSEIYIYDLQRNALSQRTFLKGCRIPAWTTDGKHILFACTGPQEGTLWWARADGGGEPYALYKASLSIERFSLSPDGRTLLVETRANEMLRVSLDTSDPDHPKAVKQELFLRTAVHGATVSFSPDGRWIAYSSNDPGESGVYVRPSAAGARGKWQISSGAARHPIWRRGAPQLLYQDHDGHILVEDYDAKGDTFLPGTPRLWVAKQFSIGLGDNPGRVFDLAPDGKRIVALLDRVKDEGPGNLHINFFVNFFDELRRRLPDGSR